MPACTPMPMPAATPALLVTAPASEPLTMPAVADTDSEMSELQPPSVNPQAISMQPPNHLVIGRILENGMRPAIGLDRCAGSAAVSVKLARPKSVWDGSPTRAAPGPGSSTGPRVCKL